MNEYTDCVNIFEDAKTNGEMVKGLIRDSQGRINIIKDTGIITLPEAEEIKNLLHLGIQNFATKRGERNCFPRVWILKHIWKMESSFIMWELLVKVCGGKSQELQMFVV